MKNSVKTSKKSTKKQGNKQVTVPASRSTVYVTKAPKGNFTSDGLTITHRELLMRVTGTVDFTVTSYTVNPALDTTFPWLAGIASRFEYYKLNDLKLTYVPKCPSTTPGTVAMAIDKDVLDSSPVTYRSMLSYQGAVSGPAWSPMTMKALPAHITRMRLYNAINPAANSDWRLYDWGKLIIATEGSAAEFGDVFVDYSVTFSVPELNEPEEALNVKFQDDAVSSTGAYPQVTGNSQIIDLFSAYAKALAAKGESLSVQNLIVGYLKGKVDVTPVQIPIAATYVKQNLVPTSGTFGALKFGTAGRYFVRYKTKYSLLNTGSASPLTFVGAGGSSLFLLEDAASEESTFQQVLIVDTPENPGVLNSLSGSPLKIIQTTAQTDLTVYSSAFFYIDVVEGQVVCPIQTLNTSLGTNFNWFVTSASNLVFDIFPIPAEVTML